MTVFNGTAIVIDGISFQCAAGILQKLVFHENMSLNNVLKIKKKHSTMDICEKYTTFYPFPFLQKIMLQYQYVFSY